MKDDDLISPVAQMPCPCGGKVTIGTGNEQQIVLHSMPPCEQFIKLDVLAFVIWLRESMQGATARTAKA